MKHRRAAASYAKALFAVAKEQDRVEVVGRELHDMVAMLAGNDRLRGVFARPWIPPSARRAVAAEIAQRSHLSRLSRDFLALLAERRRTDYLRIIEERYQKLVDADMGRLGVQVRTAAPLTDAQRGKLSRKLLATLGGRQVGFEEVVDQALLGGFVAVSGGAVLDGSLEGQLEQMRRRLARG